MENMLRPLIALGLGLVLGIGGHAAFQSVSQAPAPAAARPVATAAPVSAPKAPGALALGSGADRATVGQSRAFAEGQAAATGDGASLLTKLGTMKDGRERDEFVRGVFSAMALQSPKEAMDLALQLEDPRLQSLAIKALTMEWAFDPSTLRSEGSLETAMLGAVVALASSNPEKAALLAQTNLEGRSQQYAMMAVAKQWAQADPEGALAWAGTMKDSENGRVSMMVANSVAENDPQLAANYLDQIPDDRGRQWSASRVAESWYGKDAKAAVEWATNLTDPAMKQRAIGSVASEWAQKDPEGALKWAQTLGDPAAARSAVGSAARQWAQADPASASSYATALPSGETKTAALASVAGGWSRVDAEAAKTWAQSLPVPAERESAVQGLRSGRGGGWNGRGGGPR